MKCFDPFRCTHYNHCTEKKTDRWLFGPPEQTCVAITDVAPGKVSVSTTPLVSLFVFLDLDCLFNEGAYFTYF